MNAQDFIEVSRDAVWVMIKLGAIPMLAGLAVGVIISLIQALTQIQEMTLTFVPKLIVLFITMIIFMPFMLATIIKFTEYIFDQIIAGGR